MNTDNGRALWSRYRRAKPVREVDEPGLLQIAEFVDGTLDEAGRATVEAYLASRPEEVSLLGHPDSAEVPPDLLLRAQGLGGTGRVTTRPPVWSTWYRLPAYAAATAVFVMASVSAFEMGSATASGTDQVERALVATLTFSDAIEGAPDDRSAIW